MRSERLALAFAASIGFLGGVTKDSGCTGPVEISHNIAACETNHGIRLQHRDFGPIDIPSFCNTTRFNIASERDVMIYESRGDNFRTTYINPQSGSVREENFPKPYHGVDDC